MQQAKKLGFETLRLYTDEEDNVGAIKLYNNFRPVLVVNSKSMCTVHIFFTTKKTSMGYACCYMELVAGLEPATYCNDDFRRKWKNCTGRTVYQTMERLSYSLRTTTLSF
jgi:hypothetical protein